MFRGTLCGKVPMGAVIVTVVLTGPVDGLMVSEAPGCTVPVIVGMKVAVGDPTVGEDVGDPTVGEDVGDPAIGEDVAEGTTVLVEDGIGVFVSVSALATTFECEEDGPVVESYEAALVVVVVEPLLEALADEEVGP
jgi:hypothetical protein